MKATLLRLAPWIALGALVALAFGLPGVIAGAALLALSEVLQFLRDHAAISTAHDMALARRTADAEAVAARLTEIERQLKEALIPERMQLAKDVLKNKIAGLRQGGY